MQLLEVPTHQLNTIQKFAQVIEHIHFASLLHDDVIDEADMRHHRKTVNAQFGNSSSILLGNLFWNHAFQIALSFNSIPLISLISNALSDMTKAVFMEKMHAWDTDMSFDTYYLVISGKTARLFELALQGMYYIIKKNELRTNQSNKINIEDIRTHPQCQALNAFGHELGLAYQLYDDACDYNGSDTSKDIQRDISMGIMTYPALFSISCLPSDIKRKTLLSLKNDTDINAKIDYLLHLIHKYNGIDACYKQASVHIDNAITALDSFNDGHEKEQLCDLILSLKSV